VHQFGYLQELARSSKTSFTSRQEPEITPRYCRL